MATAEILLNFLFSQKVARTIVKIFSSVGKNGNVVLTQ